jgi:hypothetical protein
MSKFVLEIIAKRLILPISEINKSFDLVFLVFFPKIWQTAPVLTKTLSQNKRQ